MKKNFNRLLSVWAMLLCSLSLFSQDLCSPVGWATQNGGTTGGGNASPITVTTIADLQSQANSSGAKVIYVSGNLGSGVSTRVNVSSSKTIIGLPGATLYGGFTIKGSNVIVRNMKVRGPGSIDVDGVDCMTIDGSAATNIWVDHCEFYDGQDGNFDITNGANYIAVTWCKFYYTSASSNHQFCNLIGNSDSKTSDRGKLKVTFMYNWWGTGVKERMPRVRFGQVHVVNNYFNSPGNGHCVRAGIEADLRVESNYFEGVTKPIDLFENNFTAISSINNTFVSTSGNTSGSGTAFTPPYSLTITPSANVKAVVTANAGAILASPTSCGTPPPVTYTLTTNSTPTAGGTVSRNPNASSYNSGTVVTLTATPAAGYTFTGWSGDATGTTTSVNVTMNANKNVTANFAAIPTYTLTTTVSPSGGGTVSKNPNASSYNSGTVVTLTATPAAGYTFSGWSGDATGTTTSVNVTMNANKNVTATFTPVPTYTLTTAVCPRAGGSVSGAGTYNSGAVVTVTATPAAGYTFTGWSGDATGAATSVSVTMSSNKSVTANFAAIPTYTLTTTVSPSGGGTISRNPNAASYNSGTVVTLTATPAAGYSFSGWSGDATGTTTSVNVTMSADKNVTATFTPIPTYTLTTAASPVAGGTVSGAGTYNSGTVVTVTATPAAGYIFTGWSGDASGTATSVNVTMSSNKSVTANFTQSTGTPVTIRIEDNATTAQGFCLYEGSISSNSGANNGKVINLTNSAAKGANWKVQVPSSGSYTLTWRYTNGSSSNTYVMALIVNGVTITTAQPFPKTSGSSVFATSTVTVSLTAGYNTIRLESVASNATADIDWIEITGDNPVAANCAAARPSTTAPSIVSNESVRKSSASVYPNPAREKAIINYSAVEKEQISIKIYDAYGRLIEDKGTKTFNRGNNRIELNLATKSPGIYTIVLTGRDGTNKVLKLVAN